MNNSERIKEDYNDLIVKYLTNSVNENEKQILIQWIESDKLNKDRFISLYKSWLLSGSNRKETEYDSEKGWILLKDLIENSAGGGQHRKIRFSSIFKTLRLAASWLLIFATGSIVMYMVQSRKDTVFAEEIIISVPLGARGDIQLPDGSRVWINAGTKITYAQDYGIRNRTLKLEGEAFFEVAAGKKQPFIVNASELNIVALGTRFNVKAYPEEEQVLTTLEEGKVDVQLLKEDGKATSMVLLPNENVIFHKSDMSLLKDGSGGNSDTNAKPTADQNLEQSQAQVLTLVKNVNTQLYTSWKDERWIIEDEPLGTLAPMLERRYNINIAFTDEQLKNYKFTGTIENETIEQLMTALQLTSPIDFEIDKDHILLKVNPAMKNQFRQIMRTIN
jgi:ferric-dicitrate binding protein FerR (iron transport regulator)